MSKARVPLFSQPRNFVNITPEATVGATIGTNLYNADGTLFDLSQLVTGSSTTVINGVTYTHKKVTTATYALTAADDKKIIEFTYAGAIAITMSGLIPFSSGFDLLVFCSNASGQATFSGTNSMVITSSDSLKTRTQYSTVGLMVDETLQATLYGDIEPVFPALTVLARSPNSIGAPSPLAFTADGQVLIRRSSALVASTLASTDITDFNSATRAQTEAELVAGTNVTITPSSSGATRILTISATGGGGGSGNSYNPSGW